MSGSVLTCNPADIPVGGTQTYVVPVVATQPGTFNATATVTANGDSNPANNGPATSTIVVVSAAHSTPGLMLCHPSGCVALLCCQGSREGWPDSMLCFACITCAPMA